MVKESPTLRETSIKKRRKTTQSTDGDQEVDIYKKSIDFEEKDALSRDPQTDADLFVDTCSSIRELLFDIQQLKNQKRTDAQLAKIQEKSTEACIALTLLKKLNRYDKFRCLSSREALAVEKQKVDSTNLQYQNLLYEADHLISEYNKCHQFKSKDENIELVPVEDFLKDAPESTTKPFKNRDPANEKLEHELYLARLEWELTQRKQLAEQCNSYEEEKKQLATDIVKLKNRLEGLAPRLAAVLEATKPLQEHLGLPIDKIREEHKLAALLPDPLYLLYANVDAYTSVYNLNINVQILGDADEAKQFREQENVGLNQSEVESDHEIENQEVEEIAPTKKRRHRKSSHADRLEEKRNKMLEVHPLSVEITMHVKDGPVLKLKFYYYVQLKIVGVFSDVTIPSNVTGTTARDVLQGDSIVAELTEADSGTESPNPANHYQLRKVGLNSYASIVHKLGYAYNWAQKVCGLDFLLTDKNRNNANKLSQTNVENVMKVLYLRLKSRTSLALQMQQLDQNLIPIIPDSVDYPKNAVSTLTKWTACSWTQISHFEPAKVLIELEIVKQSDLFYSLSISRPTAIIQAFVIIKNNYPSEAPIFLLNLNYNGSYNALNCDDIRDMERGVNTISEQNSPQTEWLLSVQLRHLCAYLDVYLETTFPSSFPQSTVFFKDVCARNRRKPFKFRKIGAGIFTQH